jgi:hypothetical protein
MENRKEEIGSITSKRNKEYQPEPSNYEKNLEELDHGDPW